MLGRLARIPLDVIYRSPVPESTTTPQYVVQLWKSLEHTNYPGRTKKQLQAGRQKERYDCRTHGESYKVCE